MMRRVISALVGLAALIMLGSAPAANADSPIVGRWEFEGGEVSVERAAGPLLYQGVIIRTTQFTSCAHPPGQVMWKIRTGSGTSFRGEHYWYRLSDCSLLGWGPTTFDVDTSNPERYFLHFCTHNPEDLSIRRCHTLEQARPDTDGDGLIDSWEEHGIDTDGDPEPEVDLPAMGADPEFKDIFVEMDWMPHHHLNDEALATLATDVFLDAPVSNPNGDTGIALHVDNGPGSLMDPTNGRDWGGLSESDSIGHSRTFGSSTGDDYSFHEFDRVKEHHFSEDRELAFRYGLSVHSLGGDPASGITRDIGASDFILSLGGGCEPSDCSGPPTEQAHAFMHELGHTLALDHGGQDDINFKPNYLSVMNYAYTFTGIPARDVDGLFLTDYSDARVGVGSIRPLDESSLSEAIGPEAGPGPSRRFRLVRYCPGDDPEVATPRFARFNVSTDWDCDGTVEGGVVSASINGDHSFDELRSYEDWSQLQFRAGAIGAPALGPTLPHKSKLIEPDIRDLLPIASRVTGDERPRVKLRHRGRRLKVVARDDQRLYRLFVKVDGKQRKIKPRPGRRKARFTRHLGHGRHRVKAFALDGIGNRSKVKRLRVRVR